MRYVCPSFLCLLMLFFVGCAEPYTETGTDPDQAAETDDGHGHDHPSEGPHGGSLIELGGEDYHAELLNDPETGTVTVYILDASAKQTMPIEAEKITISGQSKAVLLAAQPLEADPEGKSSRFVTEDESLSEYLASGHVHARVLVPIAGKTYNGRFESHGESANP